MKAQWMRLVVVTYMAGLAGAARGADLRPAVVTNLTGNLDVEQDIPCDGHVSKKPEVNGGRIELIPALGLDQSGNRFFALTRLNVTFNGFSASGSCHGKSDSASYSDIGVQLQRTVSFTAVPTGGGGYSFTIPKADFLIQVFDHKDGDFERSYKRPSKDVTGSIDLTTAAFHIHVVTAQTIHFEGGCTPLGCLFSEDDNGTVSADVDGTIQFPDADADGVPDHRDNCIFGANADQSPVATPTVNAPDDVTLFSCLDQTMGWATGVDVCDGGAVSITNNAPLQFDVGSNTVTWTAKDAKNRTATDTQTVTIVDKTKPTFSFVPLDKTVFDCGPVDLGQATATDDCAGTPTITNDSPGYFYVGTTVVTWKATDLAGNFNTATQKVTVIDTVHPTVACTPTSPLGTSFIVTGFDACGPPVLMLGTYLIANGEQIKIQETGQPGVRLQNVVGSDGIRKFMVGKGEGVIVATDGSGNTSTAACVYPK